MFAGFVVMLISTLCKLGFAQVNYLVFRETKYFEKPVI